MYYTPEAIYTSLGGESTAAKELLSLVPNKAILSTTGGLLSQVRMAIKYTAVFTNDFMLVRRGEEKTRNTGFARRLSQDDASEYSTFGSSFNVPHVPIDWIRERLESDIIFGAFDDGRLASVASLVAWLPEVAVIMGVETKPEFRRKGLGTAVASAAVNEGLKRSEVALFLFVRITKRQSPSIKH